MKSVPRGRNTLAVEVTNVSRHGLWLLLRDQELFLPFEDFPWFEQASIGKLMNVELLSPNHLYWPDLDIDLAVESLFHPERFPLVSRVGVGPTPRKARIMKRRTAFTLIELLVVIAIIAILMALLL